MIGMWNEQLKKRTQHMLQDGIAPHVELVGSADYSLFSRKSNVTNIPKEEFETTQGL